MIISKIELFNWKNFHRCEVGVQERCFVVGANAAGKSNFIDALRFLRDVAKQYFSLMMWSNSSKNISAKSWLVW